MRATEQLVRRWFDGVWNEGRLEVIDELMGKPCVIHDAGLTEGDVHTPAEFRAIAVPLRQAIPDIHVDIQDVMADDEQVVIRFVATGTHTGDGLGVAPTRRAIRVSGMAWGKWRNGKLVEAWNNIDRWALFQQIGAVER